jgi:hypothetical protein
MICDMDRQAFSEFNISGMEATIEEVSQPIDIMMKTQALRLLWYC